MIKINNIEVNVGHFPDGTQAIEFPTTFSTGDTSSYIEVSWFYDSDEELFTLASVIDWLKRLHYEDIRLFLPYVPNARMDRIKEPNQNFSLKVFANIINSFGFTYVDVYNVHSNVSEALINNIRAALPESDIYIVIDNYHPDVIFFPDEGACKRYADLEVVKRSGLPVTFGIKKRDFKSGKILGLDVISDVDLTGKKVLIIDDICSAGGTFKYSAIKLKELGAKDVALYVSHCEDNIRHGDLLTTDLISKIYTTDSILHIKDKKIKVINTFRK